MSETFTVKTLSEKTGVPFHVIKYLSQLNRLTVVKKSAGAGYPTRFGSESVKQVQEHIARNK